MGRRAGLAALLAGALLLGFSAILVRWSAPAAPVVVGFYRMAFALPWILALGLREGTPRPGALRRGLPWALLAGLCFTADLTLWHSALHWTTAASATLLVGLAPLWVSLFSVAVLGHRLRSAAWMGLGLALAGAALLAFGGGARVGLGRGELLGFLASFGYGGYTLGLVRARRHLTGPQAMVLVTAFCLFAFGLLGLAGQTLNLFHLLGAFLGVCLSHNYAIFTAENAARGDEPPPSIRLSALTTAASFGVLALSSIPVVSALGTMVAAIVVAALVGVELEAMARRGDVRT